MIFPIIILFFGGIFQGVNLITLPQNIMFLSWCHTTKHHGAQCSVFHFGIHGDEFIELFLILIEEFLVLLDVLLATFVQFVLVQVLEFGDLVFE